MITALAYARGVSLSRRLVDRAAALAPNAEPEVLAAAAELATPEGAFAELQVHSERGPAAIAGFPAAEVKLVAAAASRFGPKVERSVERLCELLAPRATDWGAKLDLEGAAPLRTYARGPFSAADLELAGEALGAPVDTSGLDAWARALSFSQIQMIGARLDPDRPAIVAYLSAASPVADRAQLAVRIGHLIADELAGSRWPRLFAERGAELLARPRDEHVHLSVAAGARGWIKIDVGPRDSARARQIAAAMEVSLPELAAPLEALEGTRASHFGLRMGPGETAAVSIYRRIL